MKKTIVIILTIVLVGFVGVVSYLHFKGEKKNNLEKYYTKSEIYLSKNTKYTDLPSYFNFEGIEYEKITVEELKSRLNKYKVTCGLESVPEYSFGSDCLEVADNYMMYLDNGVPYFIHSTIECADDTCTVNENYYDVAKFTFIKNVKQIISKVDQYNGSDAGSEFAFELENGDVYYFTPLYDAKVINGVESYAHLVKVELPSKLVKFSNIENGQITYGTDIVLELENGDKEVLQYDYKTNKVSLQKYSDYNKENHEFDDSVELSSDEKEIKLSSNVLESPYLNNVIKNNIFISENYGDQKYSGICPVITIDGKHFHILQISNPKVFLYTNNDNSDGKKVEVYGLDEDSEYVYYAKFFAVDNEDPQNHSLELYKYNIKDIDSIALITVNDKSNMLTNDEEPNVPENYLIIKTKDGKYYTDYNIDKNYDTILREVVQK